MLCGGYGSPKDADEEVQSICDKMKSSVEQRLDKKLSETFQAISYKTQVVAGTNYMIKVHIGGEEHINITVYKTLPHAGETLSLTDVEYHST